MAKDDAGGVKTDGAEAVPVTGVVLFSCGVGYFERSGKVKGDAELKLAFKSEQINDLLKSLMVLDLDGGRVSNVTYASQDPTGRALKAFGLDLAGNPSLGALLTQLRGVRLSVTTTEGELEGTVLGVETRTEETEKGLTVSRDVLNLLTDTGIKACIIAGLLDVRILDDNLNDDLVKALAIIASSRDKQRRAVTISFSGEGERRVKVAYILEAPVWKTSYRLILGEDSPLLQGWAIVENTTDGDWSDIQLSLVSGRPISFIMDLYTPLYLPRPVVQPELFAGLRPQVYEEAMELGEEPEEYDEDDEEMDIMMEQEAPSRRAKKSMAAPMGAAMSMAPPAPSMSELAASSMAPAATGSEVGELFSYAVGGPVTVGRQSSAMLPIVAGGVGGEKVSVYNQNTHATHPYSGFKMKNTTGLSLLSGPVTVFDEDVYAGDAQLSNLQPDEDKLLSYGLDLACSVEVRTEGGPQDLLQVQLYHGSLVATYKYTQEHVYIVKNKKKGRKVVIVEHPIEYDWEITAPEKHDERTPTHIRYRMEMKPEETKKLTVSSEKSESQSIHLSSLDVDYVSFYLKAKIVSDDVKGAIKKVLDYQGELNDISRRRSKLEEQMSELGEEQDRIRSNLDSVPDNSKLYARYLKKMDDQEDAIEKLQVEIAQLRDAEGAKRKDLEKFISDIEIQ